MKGPVEAKRRDEGADGFRVLVLSSGMLTDRMLLHSGVLRELSNLSHLEVWAGSADNLDVAIQWREFARALPMRQVREYPGFLRRIRQFNEAVWSDWRPARSRL